MIGRRLAALVLAALAAAGAADARPARHMINRVNVLEPLIAVGAEPFWDISLTDGRVAWNDPAEENQTGSVDAPVLTRGKAVWRGRIDGHGPFTLTVTRGPCSDGMSEFVYPLTVHVDGYDDWVLNGCAATAAAFERRDREGREDGEVR
ncbi:MAG: hypothetical protein K1X35_08595 [Caulobacteraceae bacterium]|nr:hypothetical protein [Caulobacteraceae bacterium]